MASLGSPILDCFRNGSVVQLKSKVTSRTLTLEEGRIVNGNGPVGFYAGPLAPRTPVWGRWTDGTYHRGTMSDVDTQFHIRFNDGDTISHDVHDQTAVLADVQPDPEVVQTGSRVIAQFRGSARYYAGRITKVDRANPSNPRCDIHFDDGDKDSVNLNVIRMLPEATSRTSLIAMNSRVLGRWTNNQYYRGRVTSVGSKVDITFDDGDKVQHDFSDVSAVICDVNPKAGIIQMGSRVVGFWPNSKTFYMGKVVQVDFRNPHQPRYFVRFDDGDQIWCTLNEIRPVPMSRESVGCVVWGRWTNSLYYHGCVTGTSGGKIYVTFDDGDKVSHDLKDVSAVIIDAVPNPANIPVGSRVIGAWPGKSHFYKGTVKQIDPTNSCAPRYHVTYDDGDNSWVSFDQIRLLPMQTNEAQFTAVQIGGNVVALKSVAFPQYFLGTDGKKLLGKVFDNYCHFYVHETPDQYVSLEFCMSPGQHVGVNSDGTATAPASTNKSNHAFFEVKLLFSPYGQAYHAEHCHTGGYPAPTPGYPQPGPYPTPPSGGGYPAPPPGGYPQPGGCPGGYPTGSHPPPSSGGYPGGYPSAPPAGGGYPAGGYPGGYPTGYAPAPGGYPGGFPPGTQPPPPGGYPGGFPPGTQPPPPGGYPGGFPPGTQPPPPGGYPGYGAHPP